MITSISSHVAYPNMSWIILPDVQYFNQVSSNRITLETCSLSEQISTTWLGEVNPIPQPTFYLRCLLHQNPCYPQQKIEPLGWDMKVKDPPETPRAVSTDGIHYVLVGRFEGKKSADILIYILDPFVGDVCWKECGLSKLTETHFFVGCFCWNSFHVFWMFGQHQDLCLENGSV